MRELELLAPARNIEIGIAAIDCGADAVYLAGPAFGARQAAGNSVEDIRRLCGYAHRFGARVFVTLNTILFDDELEEAFALAVRMQEAGADALIVQDFALPAFESEHPERLSIPLHASTQCSIRTVEQARRMDALGFSRIVLERELPMATVREICSAVSCEVEAFVHGALCVCYSGQCYLSEMLSGRSANRGECVQACRSRYDLVNAHGEPVRLPWTADGPVDQSDRDGQGRTRTDRDGAGRPVALNRTLLSLRDLNLLDRLPEMAEGGVGSFKIEGRLKNISYVRNIVAAYSQALDRFVNTHPDRYRRASFGRSDFGFTPAPAKSFNRGFTQLFFDGGRARMACLDAGKALGEEVGTVSAVQRTRDGMRVSVKPSVSSDAVMTRKNSGSEAEAPRPRLHNGDGFSFIGGNGEETGFRADVCEGDAILCRPVEGLTPGARLYRNLDTAFEKEVGRGAVRRIAVRLSVEIRGDDGKSDKGDRDFLVAVRAVSEDGREVLYSENLKSEPARNRERMLGMISGQLGKDTGIYRFAVDDILCDGGGIFGGGLPMMSAACLNGIRRAIAEKLDSLPCNARPMNRQTVRDSLPGELKFPKRISYKSDVANTLAASFYRRLGVEKVEPAFELLNRGLRTGDFDGASAKNSTPRNDGNENSDHGDDSAGNGGMELMRSRYCLLHELGLCRRSPAYAALAAANDLSKGLYLRNNGRLLALRFDCKVCEMTVSAK